MRREISPCHGFRTKQVRPPQSCAAQALSPSPLQAEHSCHPHFQGAEEELPPFPPRLGLGQRLQMLEQRVKPKVSLYIFGKDELDVSRMTPVFIQIVP